MFSRRINQIRSLRCTVESYPSPLFSPSTPLHPLSETKQPFIRCCDTHHPLTVIAKCYFFYSDKRSSFPFVISFVVFVTPFVTARAKGLEIKKREAHGLHAIWSMGIYSCARAFKFERSFIRCSDDFSRVKVKLDVHKNNLILQLVF